MKKRAKRVYRKAKQSKKVRFGLVGIVNTTVDFSILNLLSIVFGWALVPANILSATCAMIVSFTLNKTKVFQDSGDNHIKQLVLFLTVTLIGIWFIQTSVMYWSHEFLVSLVDLPNPLLLNISKIIGIAVGMVWNYTWYSRIIFKKND